MISKTPVSTIMTEKVITVNKTDDIEKAEHFFKQHHIRHLPVVEDDKVVGMLSYTDIQRLSFADITNENEGDVDALVYNLFSINQIMKRNVVCVSPTHSIKEIAEIFAQKEFHALPVVANNKLVGIVTTTDLIMYMLKQF